MIILNFNKMMCKSLLIDLINKSMPQKAKSESIIQHKQDQKQVKSQQKLNYPQKVENQQDSISNTKIQIKPKNKINVTNLFEFQPKYEQFFKVWDDNKIIFIPPKSQVGIIYGIQKLDGIQCLTLKIQNADSERLYIGIIGKNEKKPDEQIQIQFGGNGNLRIGSQTDITYQRGLKRGDLLKFQTDLNNGKGQWEIFFNDKKHHKKYSQYNQQNLKIRSYPCTQHIDFKCPQMKNLNFKWIYYIKFGPTDQISIMDQI